MRAVTMNFIFATVDMQLCVTAGKRPFSCCRLRVPLRVLDHHLDAPTELVGAPKRTAALMLLLVHLLHLFWAGHCGFLRGLKASSIFAVHLTVGVPELAVALTLVLVHRLHSFLAGTLRDPEGANGSPGLRSAHGLSSRGWVVAACSANTPP